MHVQMQIPGRRRSQVDSVPGNKAQAQVHVSGLISDQGCHSLSGHYLNCKTRLLQDGSKACKSKETLQSGHLPQKLPYNGPWVIVPRVRGSTQPYTPYSARMSPDTTDKHIGFYMGGLILGTILQYMVSASLSCLIPTGCVGLSRPWLKN